MLKTADGNPDILHERECLNDLLGIAVGYLNKDDLSGVDTLLACAALRIETVREWIDARRQDKLEEQSQ